MLSLSTAARLEKNKLYSDGAWLVLLEIIVPMLPNPIQVVRNTEDITWNGDAYIAFPFELDDINEESKGEIPSVTLRVSNVLREVQSYVEQANGADGTVVFIRVIHSKHTDVVEPEIELEFSVTSISANSKWVSFVLGPSYSVYARRPGQRYLKNFCDLEYKGPECASTSALPTCGRTLPACRARNNSERFGGVAGIPTGGFYV